MSTTAAPIPKMTSGFLACSSTMPTTSVSDSLTTCQRSHLGKVTKKRTKTDGGTWPAHLCWPAALQMEKVQRMLSKSGAPPGPRWSEMVADADEEEAQHVTEQQRLRVMNIPRCTAYEGSRPPKWRLDANGKFTSRLSPTTGLHVGPRRPPLSKWDHSQWLQSRLNS